MAEQQSNPQNPETVATEPRRRPGGRSARVRRAVLDATVRVLVEQGYEHLSMEAVAERAGVHKTTLYRRWATREALVTEAALDHMGTRVPMPDTGALRTDLVALLDAVSANIGEPEGAAFVRIYATEGDRLPELHAAVRRFWTARFGMATELVRRGVERGELPAGVDADLLVETLIAPLYLRLLVTGEALGARHARRVVDLVLEGAGAGTPTGERTARLPGRHA